MNGSEGSAKLSLAYKTKRAVVSTSLLALATAFETLSKHCPELQAEIANWEDGRVVTLGVLPGEPAISIKKEGDRIVYLGKGVKDPNLAIFFKNMDSAILPLTGQMGSHTAFVQHRAILHGNIYEAMQMNRAMAIVQGYLMPGFIMKKISKRPPKMSASQLMLKARLMATLTFGLIMNAGK